MAAPVPVKTYEYAFHTALSGPALPFHRDLMLALKNSLLGFATNPWTVRYSSGAGVAGVAGDGIDRWTTATDLVWNTTGSSHSWIVLTNSLGWELLIDLRGANNSSFWCQVSVVFQGAGFSGGTLTAGPTSSDAQEITITNEGYWAGGGTLTTPAQIQMHMHKSTDDRVLRILFYNAGVCSSAWRIEELANPPTVANAWIAGVRCTNSVVSPMTSVVNTGATALAGYLTGTGQPWSTFVFSGVGRHTAGNIVTTGILPEAWSGDIYLPNQGVFVAEATNHGPKGETFDSWWIQSPPPTVGDTLPAGLSRTLIVSGQTVFPNNGAANPVT